MFPSIVSFWNSPKGDRVTVWQVSEGGYSYKLESRGGGSKTINKSYDDVKLLLQQRGYTEEGSENNGLEKVDEEERDYSKRPQYAMNIVHGKKGHQTRTPLGKSGPIEYSFDAGQSWGKSPTPTTWGTKKVEEAGKVVNNFTGDDIKALERMDDLQAIKQRAFELISTPSAKPMKPEKVAWFKRHLETKNSKLSVIKMMYDLLLSGEGNAVIGNKFGMAKNSYQARFNEADETDIVGLPANKFFVVSGGTIFPEPYDTLEDATRMVAKYRSIGHHDGRVVKSGNPIDMNKALAAKKAKDTELDTAYKTKYPNGQNYNDGVDPNINAWRQHPVGETAGDQKAAYGVQYKVFAGKEGRITTKEKWFKSSELRQKFCDKVEQLGNFYEFDGYSDPQGVEEGNDFVPDLGINAKANMQRPKDPKSAPKTTIQKAADKGIAAADKSFAEKQKRRN